jgi:hypothetical protein
MIQVNKREQTVSLLDQSGAWITVSDRDYLLYGIDAVHLVRANQIKILWRGKWDYLLHHWGREDERDCRMPTLRVGANPFYEPVE